jgi:hypothetical protein
VAVKSALPSWRSQPFDYQFRLSKTQLINGFGSKHTTTDRFKMPYGVSCFSGRGWIALDRDSYTPKAFRLVHLLSTPV